MADSFHTHADPARTAAQWLGEARKAIVLTGAGVSTESGIPDFRSETGLWARYNPAEYATLGAFMRDPAKVWNMLAEMEELLNARPNPGHIALAELESAGAVAGIITQNIDGLHQAAGSSHVVEYHGSHRTFSCLTCGATYSREAVQELPRPPRCTRENARGEPCGTILKPDVVFFDEMIPRPAVLGAAELVQGADLIFVAGTSCEVYPAADIPDQVRRQGGRIVEVNREPAPHLGAHLTLSGLFSEVMPTVVDAWRTRHS